MINRTAILMSLVTLGLALFAPRARADERADLKQRFQERYSTLLKLKDAGKVGETEAGQVAVVKGTNADDKVDASIPKSQTIKEFLATENKDRARLYELIAKDQKQTSSEVAAQNAVRSFKAAAPEHFLLVKNKQGDLLWLRKKELK